MDSPSCCGRVGSGVPSSSPINSVMAAAAAIDHLERFGMNAAVKKAVIVVAVSVV